MQTGEGWKQAEAAGAFPFSGIMMKEALPLITVHLNLPFAIHYQIYCALESLIAVHFVSASCRAAV